MPRTVRSAGTGVGAMHLFRVVPNRMPNVPRRNQRRWNDRHQRLNSRNGLLLVNGRSQGRPRYRRGVNLGSEDVMKKIKNAKTAKLILVDGPTVALRCHGGKNGTRWVKAMRA
jgi:hypothetical protein